MAFKFFHEYGSDIEERMRSVFQTLGEKEKRRYAAVEAIKLPHGGIQYIAEVLGCSRRTIERGIEELDELPDDPAAGKQRRPGGGRKKATEAEPDLENNLYEVLDFRLAGDPDDPLELWTDLGLPEMTEELKALGTPISGPTLETLLDELGISRRKIDKSLSGGDSPDRNEQFEYIAAMREDFAQRDNPVFSLDTKAKEHLGFLYREGRTWRTTPERAYDHDYPSWADGVLIPHGIFDLRRNHGHINLGTSHDTSQFACESFRWYWKRIARRHYPRAEEILWLVDSGGSNNCRHQIFKQDLETLAGEIGLPIRVAHYPTYCSKYNPIERRFFPHVTRACQGMLLDTIETAVRLMRKTKTKTGLTSSVRVIEKVYNKGRKVRDNFRETARIVYDTILPQWNYTALAN
jgi:biotin operon repressor